MAVAAGAAAVIGGAASYAGSKKQADAAKRGSNQQLSMFNTLNAQQQPFIQSGYGAMSRLNTLLGLGGGGGAGGVPSGGSVPPVVNNGPTGPGVRLPPRLEAGPTSQAMPGGMGDMPQNMRLKQILALRARNGDSEAQRILGSV